MYLILWRYVVEGDRDMEFRDSYGPGGEWSRLFAESPAFRGVELVALETPGHYITIDRWSSKDEFDEFMVHKLRDYERLDRVHEAITISEELLGKGSA